MSKGSVVCKKDSIILALCFSIITQHRSSNKVSLAGIQYKYQKSKKSKKIKESKESKNT